MGADAVAFGIAAVAATRGRQLRSFSVRKEVKDHGAGGRIAGALEPGDKVAIVEDAVTRGVSMLEAAEVVREAGRRAGAAAAGGRPGRHRRGPGRRAGHPPRSPSSPPLTSASDVLGGRAASDRSVSSRVE